MKNSIIFMVGNFASKLLMFFLLPLYTNVLEPSEYGEMDIYINILAIFYSVVSLQSGESVFRFMVDAKTENEKISVVSNSLIIAIFGMTIYTIGMLLFGWITDFKYTLVFILYVIFNIFAVFSQQIIRGLNYTKIYSTVGVLSTLVQVAGNILFIFVCGLGAVSLLWAHVLTYIFIFVVLLIKCKFFRYFKPSYIKLGLIKEHLKFNIPLLPNALCIWGVSSLGKYLLLVFYSTSEVGLLAFATKFSQLISAVNGIIFLAWQQSAISEYESEDKNEYATDVFNKFISLELGITSAIIIFVKFLIFTIMGEEYRLAWIYVPVFFIGAIFNFCGNFASIGFFGAKKTNTVFFSSLAAVVVYLIVGYFGAKEFYILGVGVAYALAQFIYYLVIQIRVKKYMYAKPLLKKLLVPLIMFISSVLLYYVVDTWYLLIVVAIGYGCLTLMVNRGFIKEVLSSLLGKIGKKN